MNKWRTMIATGTIFSGCAVETSHDYFSMSEISH